MKDSSAGWKVLSCSDRGEAEGGHWGQEATARQGGRFSGAPLCLQWGRWRPTRCARRALPQQAGEAGEVPEAARMVPPRESNADACPSAGVLGRQGHPLHGSSCLSPRSTSSAGSPCPWGLPSAQICPWCCWGTSQETDSLPHLAVHTQNSAGALGKQWLATRWLEMDCQLQSHQARWEGAGAGRRARTLLAGKGLWTDAVHMSVTIGAGRQGPREPPRPLSTAASPATLGKSSHPPGSRRGVPTSPSTFRRVPRAARERSSRLGGTKGVLSWVCSGSGLRKAAYRTREACEGNARQPSRGEGRPF